MAAGDLAAAGDAAMKAATMLVLVLFVGAVAQGDQGASAPIFRSRATVVTLAVSVRKGNTPVLGLAPSDFVVLDNKVMQDVERVTYETVPIDITLLLDVSGSVTLLAEHIRREASAILGLLQPDDRVRVLSFNHQIHELVPLQPPAAVVVPPLTAGSGTRLRDALNAALILPADPDRRRLVVAVTDSVDTYSVASSAALLDVARRSDAALYVLNISAAGWGATAPSTIGLRVTVQGVRGRLSSDATC